MKRNLRNTDLGSIEPIVTDLIGFEDVRVYLEECQETLHPMLLEMEQYFHTFYCKHQRMPIRNHVYINLAKWRYGNMPYQHGTRYADDLCWSVCRGSAFRLYERMTEYFGRKSGVLHSGKSSPKRFRLPKPVDLPLVYLETNMTWGNEGELNVGKGMQLRTAGRPAGGTMLQFELVPVDQYSYPDCVKHAGWLGLIYWVPDQKQEKQPELPKQPERPEQHETLQKVLMPAPLTKPEIPESRDKQKNRQAVDFLRRRVGDLFADGVDSEAHILRKHLKDLQEHLK